MRTDCTAQGTLLNALWGPKCEGNPKKRGTCICMADYLCCVVETNTTLSSSYPPTKINQKTPK